MRKHLLSRSRAVAAVAVVVTAVAGIPPVLASDEPGDAYPGTSDLTSGWAIRSSAEVGTDGAAISRPDYGTAGWLPLSRPETLMAGLLENGRYPDVFHSENLKKVPTEQFDVDWWYRDQLTVHAKPGQHSFVVINGVSGKADLWINGTKLGTGLQGSYARYEYDVTDHLRDGANAIALKVSRNDADITKFDTPMRYLTQNFVDWNPIAPDQGTGLLFAPQLLQDGPVSVSDTHVVQENAKDLSTSDLTVKADLRNNTGKDQWTRFTATVSHGADRVTCTATYKISAHATTEVALGKNDCDGLHVVKPAVWWPYQLGKQPLYKLDTDAAVDGRRSDGESTEFGIRTVTSSLTKPVPGKTHGKDGYRQYSVNGVPLVIRGGGWSPDMFLRYDAKNAAQQIAYVKNLGLNALRFEGNFPPDDMFRQLDRAGVLAMPGWQCCAAWEYDSKTWSSELKENAANQAANVARQLRDHASVFTYLQGSDNEPDAAKEKIFLDAFRDADWQTPQVAAAEYKSSAQLGPAGTKEGGYNYSPPSLWWANGPETVTPNDPTLSMNGSAWGLDTEVGTGNTVPTQDSLDRFLTKDDQRKIWDPKTSQGQEAGDELYHTFFYADYTRLARMGVYNTPLWHRYGPWSDAASYQKTAQLGQYEVNRALFESYVGRSKDVANPSTGVIYWMANKAWPSLQWSLYGYDFDQPGGYFGAKKANEPVHIMRSYDDGSVLVANLTGKRQSGLKATISFVDIDGKVRGSKSVPVPALGTQDVRTVLKPSVPAGISKTYFAKLTLTRGSQVVSRNVYWLSTKPDEVDWDKTHAPGQYTPSNGFAVFKDNGYADLQGLHSLRQASVDVTSRTVRAGETTVTIRNTSDHPTPAVFTRADLFANGKQILPVQWSDNAVTLWPGEKQTITARYSPTGTTPQVRITGWNVKTQQH